MVSKTLHHPLDYELTLYDRRLEQAIMVQALELSVDELDGSIIRCLLSFQISFECYQEVDAHAMFNLLPEVRGQIFGGALQPVVDVEIEAKLDPALIFPLFSLGITSIEALATHLLETSQQQPDDDLVNTESWFALNVKQAVSVPPEIGEGQLKIGYQTTWATAG